MPLITINHDAQSFEECYGIVNQEMQEVGNQLMRDIHGVEKMPTDQYTKELTCVCIGHAITATCVQYWKENCLGVVNYSNEEKVKTTKVIEFLLTDPDKHIEALKLAFFTKVYYDNASPISRLLRTIEQSMEEITNG